VLEPFTGWCRSFQPQNCALRPREIDLRAACPWSALSLVVCSRGVLALSRSSRAAIGGTLVGANWRALMAAKQEPNSEIGRRRGKGRPFRPGQSGNPKGRPPKGASIAECIRSLAGEDGAPYVERLHAIALGENVRNAITAMEVLLDRGYARCASIWKSGHAWTQAP